MGDVIEEIDSSPYLSADSNNPKQTKAVNTESNRVLSSYGEGVERQDGSPRSIEGGENSTR